MALFYRAAVRQSMHLALIFLGADLRLMTRVIPAEASIGPSGLTRTCGSTAKAIIMP